MTHGAKPYGKPETVAPDRFKRGKPEDFVGKTGSRSAKRMHPALGIRDNEHPELGLTGSFLEVTRDGISQIGFDLSFPHRKSFMPEVDFKKCGKGLLRSEDLKIAIRDEASTGFKRFVET